MPRLIAPQPSEEFNIVLAKPFSGAITHKIQFTGQPNGSATIHVTNHSNGKTSDAKTGEISESDVKELLSLTSQLRGFMTSDTKDIYGKNVILETNGKTEGEGNFMWSSADAYEGSIQQLSEEDKKTFGDVVDSIENLARQSAKHDAAV